MSGFQNVTISPTTSYATTSPASGQSLAPFADLNLTEQQRTQIRSILQSAKQGGTSQADVESQIDAVLTPTQQQTLAADKAKHHHHGGSAPGSSGAEASAAGASGTTAAAATGLATSTESAVDDDANTIDVTA